MIRAAQYRADFPEPERRILGQYWLFAPAPFAQLEEVSDFLTDFDVRSILLLKRVKEGVEGLLAKHCESDLNYTSVFMKLPT